MSHERNRIEALRKVNLDTGEEITVPPELIAAGKSIIDAAPGTALQKSAMQVVGCVYAMGATGHMDKLAYDAVTDCLNDLMIGLDIETKMAEEILEAFKNANEVASSSQHGMQ